MIGATSTNASKRPGWGFRRNLAAVGLVILAVVGSSAAQETFSSGSSSGSSSAPATAPATSVFVMPVETSPAMPRKMPPLPAAKTVDEGLDLTYMEGEILNSVRDFDSQDLHKAMFVLLRRAAALPELDADRLGTLDRPSYRNMLEKPERYRGEPIRLSVFVTVVERYDDKYAGWPTSRWWERKRPVWRLGCFSADAGKGKAWDHPLVVFTHLDPAGIFGAREDKDGRISFEPALKVELAGIFFKVYEAEERGEKKTDRKRRRMYPVIVAWQIEKTGTAPSEPALDSKTYIILLIVVMLVFLYMYFKRVTRRQRQGGRAGYRSPGDLSKIEPQPEVVGEPRAERDQADDAGEVDPDLKAAAEAYRKEKGLDDDANDRG